MQSCAAEVYAGPGSVGDVASPPALAASAKWMETWTSQQMAQILKGDRVDTHGALDLLERWKYLSLQCGRGITEGVPGNWQAEIN